MGWDYPYMAKALTKRDDLSASAKQLPKQNIFFPLEHPAALLREFAN
jgi:hypothetical protein